MLIYILILLCLLCLLDIIRTVILICTVVIAEPDEMGEAVAGLIWRIVALGAKITALVFVILLL
jgi:hypothetical protein